MPHRKLESPLPSIRSLRSGDATLGELFQRELVGPDREGTVRGSLLPVVRSPEGGLRPGVPGAAQDLMRSVGRAATGQPTVGDAANIAGAGAVGGLGAARAGLSGDLGIFGGVRAAKNIEGSKGRRFAAMRLEQAGRSPEEIHGLTGFSKGADGKWRFEISDNSAIVRQTATTEPKLGQVLIHPQLYRHYPDLENIEVVPFERGKGGIPKDADAFYQPAWGDQPEMIGLPVDVDLTGAKTSLLHEAQHAVQFREGFGAGGDTTKEFVERAARALIKRAKDTGNEDFERGMRRRLQEFNNMSEQEQQLQIATFYNRMAGEVEARNVEERQGMRPSERRQSLPEHTEDVPRYAQIVLSREELGNGLAARILGIE